MTQISQYVPSLLARTPVVTFVLIPIGIVAWAAWASTGLADAAQKAGLAALDLSALGEPVGPTPIMRGGRVAGHSYGNEYFAYSRKVEKAVSTWWGERAAEITPEQNTAMWTELFPEPCFYGVRQVEVGD